MKKNFFYSMLAASFLMFGAVSCGNEQRTDSKDIAEDMNERVFEDTYLEDDAAFAVDAANDYMGNLDLSKLAAQQAVSAEVKQLAQKIVDEQGKILEELKSIVSKKNIALPSMADNDHKEELNNLSGKTGNDFDKAYLDYLVDNQKDELKLFEKQASNGKDPDIQVWAAEKVSLLRQQLSTAENTRAAIK